MQILSQYLLQETEGWDGTFSQRVLQITYDWLTQQVLELRKLLFGVSEMAP
jgi:hypothetical protein